MKDLALDQIRKSALRGRTTVKALLTAQRRVQPVIGGTGTGKTHLAIAIARALLRNGTRGRH